eukprot:CAMPEP_0198238462 /NCGR_PEP_ID=MMETSP1446-20131203/4091_1 /TAXON_ID=1461542 ORGANISM="Unidentified sp, Strain CCMP2111" /NCGR_SAMPLE_ID=MMETSP1446 /ASSEMBLY_ACC=CAM_ASM_001112 /LENGTH=53 /DNA_ID=CAMNT_0043920875 /DNA_START=423 /DNA_END=581 /DNA_ORIENTATION=+
MTKPRPKKNADAAADAAVAAAREVRTAAACENMQARARAFRASLGSSPVPSRG